MMSVVPSGTVWQPRRDFGVMPGAMSSSSSSASVASLQDSRPCSDDDVAGRASAHAAARVVEAGFDALGDIENAAGKAVVAVGNFLRIDLDSFAAGKKRDFVFLRGGRVFDFFDVRVASAHVFASLNRLIVVAEIEAEISRFARNDGMS